MSGRRHCRGVDFHCHLDLYPDHEAAIARAESAGVYTLTVTTTPKAWRRNFELTRGTRYVRAALGLHPQLAADRAAELPLWKQYMSETRYIGEVGLDAGPRYYKSLGIQKNVFRTILQRCTEAGGKILTVHSVRSAPAVLDMVEQYLPQDRGVVVLHWFTGSRSEARRGESLGCYFSINSEMMRSERGRILVAGLPKNRILTETDGPFTMTKGRPAEPADYTDTILQLAQVHNVSAEDMADTVTENLRMLLCLENGVKT